LANLSRWKVLDLTIDSHSLSPDYSRASFCRDKLWRESKYKNMMRYYLYILSNKRNGDIYVGTTSDLIGRVGEHKSNIFGGFTKNTGIHNLVYYEEYNSLQEAITRERQIKRWKRQWKINLIEKLNPEWKDLYEGLLQKNK